MGRKSAVFARTERTPPPPLPAELMDEAEDLAPPVEDVEDEEEAEAVADGTELVETAATDNVGEQSIEINVESLIAELEAESRQGKAAETKCARRKLEDFLERKRIARDLEDFEDFLVEE
ncbi:MAG: hypothetical protein J0M16_06040 [Gammaproteobacteria bacterium]|jgi:hypothetical protein|nr:hypothetical protein [Gammaproteobacteria bacterium]